VGAEIFTNFWCFVHTFDYRYARKSFKGSKDADFGLESEKILSNNNGPMGWGPGPGKSSQKHPHLWRSPRKKPTENENFFFYFDYKTCWIRRGFEQLSSSIAWRVMGLQSSAWNVVYYAHARDWLPAQQKMQSCLRILSTLWIIRLVFSTIIWWSSLRNDVRNQFWFERNYLRKTYFPFFQLSLLALNLFTLALNLFAFSAVFSHSIVRLLPFCRFQDWGCVLLREIELL